MKEPTPKQLKALRKRYNELIAEAQAKCITDFQEVRKYVFSKLLELKEDKQIYKELEAYIVKKYNEMFIGLKGNILDNYNECGVIEYDFASQTLGEPIKYIPAVVSVLPNTQAFEITNRILAEKSVLKRSKLMANQVTQAIAKSFENDSSIQAVQKKIDIIMGFRNKDGLITPKAKELIINGKFSHRNGHIYQTYRIARTETMRMASLRTHEIFSAVERDDKRLKLLAVLDSRTRAQSAMMNGQISDEKGRFLYPDGIRCKLGEAAAQYAINDRETQYVVFLDNPQYAKELKEQNKAKVSDFRQFYEQTKGVATALQNSMPVGKITTEYLRDNFDKELRKHYFVSGKINNSIKNLLGSDTNELRLSFDNFVKNQAKHPEISFKMYKKIVSYINSADKSYFNKGNLIIEKKINGQNLLIALKTTKNKNENYFLSMYFDNHSKK